MLLWESINLMNTGTWGELSDDLKGRDRNTYADQVTRCRRQCPLIRIFGTFLSEISILSCASVQKLIGRLGYGVPVQSCTIFTNASKISVILSSRICALI